MSLCFERYSFYNRDDRDGGGCKKSPNMIGLRKIISVWVAAGLALRRRLQSGGTLGGVQFRGEAVAPKRPCLNEAVDTASLGPPFGASIPLARWWRSACQGLGGAARRATRDMQH
jgi:hypothetical protein